MIAIDAPGVRGPGEASGARNWARHNTEQMIIDPMSKLLSLQAFEPEGWPLDRPIMSRASF
jgi:hypothetical protein